jgi:hypothetical protein
MEGPLLHCCRRVQSTDGCAAGQIRVSASSSGRFAHRRVPLLLRGGEQRSSARGERERRGNHERESRGGGVRRESEGVKTERERERVK